MRNSLRFLFNKLSGKMNITRALLMACSFGFALPSQGKFTKRIVNGYPMRSHDDYGTYHFIQLRRSWGCITNQANHELGGCQDRNHCGGTLFHPEFVITAGHCVESVEFYLKKIGDVYDVPQVFGSDETLTEQQIREYGRFNEDIQVTVADPKYNHGFYSNIALLAGSVDWFGMNQIRHAAKKFPHPSGVAGSTSMFKHDVALIHVCQPFDITNTVKIAPVVPMDKMKAQWERIIQRSTACLYVGFGRTEDQSTEYKSGELVLRTRYMRYTWRKLGCYSFCQAAPRRNHPKNPCAACSHHIYPKKGAPHYGDSGSPIACDGYYVALHSSGFIKQEINASSAVAYPIYCIKDALTLRRLYYYKKVPAGQAPLELLGPVLPLRHLNFNVKYDLLQNSGGNWQLLD